MPFRTPDADEIVRGLCILFVTVFIGTDLLGATGWSWKGLLHTLRNSLVSLTSGREIHNYVEFITLKQGRLDIVTGIRFASSYSGKIDRQWCYATNANAGRGDVRYQLSLARKNGHDPIRPAMLTSRNLRPLDLTKTQARALIKNYCRFKK